LMHPSTFCCTSNMLTKAIEDQPIPLNIYILSAPAGWMKRGTKFLDLRGQKSPFALIRIAKEVKKAKPDEILEFLVDDPATVDEIPPWSERTGNKIISMKKEDGSWIIRIRRRS